jgi:hypothetical protein
VEALLEQVSETGRAIDVVRVRMATGDTGCWTVHVPGRGACKVYVMEGELIATQSSNDPFSVLDRLVARGRVSPEDAHQIRDAGHPEPVSFEQIERVADTALIGRLMGGRFRDNLVFHLFDAGRFSFEPMHATRVAHLQMGHDSAGLLRELEVVHQRVSPWMDVQRERMMTWGDHSPGSPQQRHIQALCSAGLRLDRLVRSSPFFPAQTLVLVAQMVESGSLLFAEAASDDGPRPGAVSHAIQTAVAEKARRREAAADREGADVLVSPMTPGSDLAAFGDNERESRGVGKGSFMGDTERVDLRGSTRKTLDKSPGLRLSSPTLSSKDIVSRIGVCNEVLSAMVVAWNDQHGAGEGRRMAQLFLDGAPMDYAALFRSASVDAKGRMGAASILKNIERRPESERRDLVTKGLSDLIDRVLGRCAEGLDERRLDQMLQQVAGYRQRLGW